jgi:hypothetical protein
MSVKKLLVPGFAAVLGAALTIVFLHRCQVMSPPSVATSLSGPFQDQPAEALVPPEPALTVQALMAEYTLDAVAAELKYPKGKLITVSGVVQRTQRQPEGNIAVDIGVRMEHSLLPPGYLTCITLDPNLVAPPKGEIVTVVGTKYSANVREHPVYGTHTYIVLTFCAIKERF